MTRRDAEFAQFAGRDQEFGFTVEDFVFGADDVATEGGHVSLFVGRAINPPLFDRCYSTATRKAGRNPPYATAA
ncbi:hypothetical protein GCM10027430_32480 [Lysobacter tyrosinilyticus]